MNLKKTSLCSLLALCLASSAYAETRTTAFTPVGSNKVTSHASTADKMTDPIAHSGQIKCEEVVNAVDSARQQESISRQTVIDQVTGQIDFNPLVNCQKIASNISEQIASSGGSFGMIGAVLAQLGGNAACSYGPISRGVSTYNGYAKSATNVAKGVGGAYEGYNTGNIGQTTGGIAKAGKASGVISSGTAGTISKTGNASQQAYEGYNSGNVKQTSKGSQTIINSGSKYLSGAN